MSIMKVTWLLVGILLLTAANGSDIKKQLKEWEKALSGKPTNCRRLVDLFIPNGIYHGFIHDPAGTIVGQRPMFKACEMHLITKFPHVEAFINGPIYVRSGYASFERTVLLVNDIGCRITWHGHIVVKYNDDLKITELWDYYDEEEFKQMKQMCQFPEDEDDEDDADTRNEL